MTVSREPSLNFTPAHRGRWKRMEAVNERGPYLGLMNVIRNYNDENIRLSFVEISAGKYAHHDRCYETDVISASLDRAYFVWCRCTSTIRRNHIGPDRIIIEKM